MDTKTKTLTVDEVLWPDDGEADALPGTSARPSAAEPFHRVLTRAVSRRVMLRGMGATAATLALAPTFFLKAEKAQARPAFVTAGDPGSRLTFETVLPRNEPDVVVPSNYEVDILLRWGDPLTPEAPEFDVSNQTGASQAQQFGFNADLVLWYPLPEWVVRRVMMLGGQLDDRASRVLGLVYPRAKDNFSQRALVIVNHEYTSGDDMFPGYDASDPTQDQVEAEIEAHGFSIVELELDNGGRWQFNRNSQFNRRSTGSTPMEITGPLRGDLLMQTAADPTGMEVFGSLNNCAGGKTPWGTILTCEENFDQYFANFPQAGQAYELSKRIAAPSGESGRKWERYDSRFDLSQDPQEYHRFGYIVEIDPYNPRDKPKKRTALGRCKHEGAAASIAPDGRVAIYSGDDARFEYVYKFVTKHPYDRRNRQANLSLLDEGKLYVARFDAGDAEDDDMGTGQWLLVHDTDFPDAAALIDTRGTADALGATPMDRPEDIEVSPKTGHVFIALTNNSRRDGDPGDTRVVNGRVVSSAPDEANPRNDTYNDGNPDSNTGNQHGHIVELIEDGDDPNSLTFRWNILVKCGDPAVPAHRTSFGDIVDPVAAGVSPISDPDNLVHDDDGNLWIATDGQFFSGGPVGFGQNDGIFAVPVEGEDRGLLRQFLSGVPRAEVCGPEFSGDNRSFFCAIQHPWDGQAFTNFWPLDEESGSRVSKPSLIAVREKGGQKIGKGPA
ncbi:MAG: DUF839 domain-containing protein [Gammaproteobacteria bacterium]|jgi:secreted PhoX family phosphatase|nr:DUF839 domain-containing protein [Gammaproteobacteria bacterium]